MDTHIELYLSSVILAFGVVSVDQKLSADTPLEHSQHYPRDLRSELSNRSTTSLCERRVSTVMVIGGRVALCRCCYLHITFLPRISPLIDVRTRI